MRKATDPAATTEPGLIMPWTQRNRQAAITNRKIELAKTTILTRKRTIALPYVCKDFFRLPKAPSAALSSYFALAKSFTILILLIVSTI